MVNATENLCVCALGMFFNQGLLTVYSMYFSFLSFTMLSILNGKTHDIKQNVIHVTVSNEVFASIFFFFFFGYMGVGSLPLLNLGKPKSGVSPVSVKQLGVFLSCE